MVWGVRWHGRWVQCANNDNDSDNSSSNDTSAKAEAGVAIEWAWAVLHIPSIGYGTMRVKKAEVPLRA